MSTDVLTASAGETVGEVARRMVERWAGAAVLDPHDGAGGPGIVTERDVVEAVGAEVDVASASVDDHSTREANTAAPDWSLDHAARTMSDGDFRHLVVAEGGRTVGIISMRDIVRSWTSGRWQHRKTQIREAMNRDFVLLDRDERLQTAARKMVERQVGAVVVKPPKPKAPPGIVTDRELLVMVAEGADPSDERVSGRLSRRMTFSAPDWSLKQAAEAMSRGGFQHVVVVDGTGIVGLISMRDMVRRLLA